jgi:hypothetical protein
LVAPVALYPDLVLVLALQASLAPLDVVQAQRFLDRYADDPSLAPDPDWDEKVLGSETTEVVAAIDAHDPDGTWSEVTE